MVYLIFIIPSILNTKYTVNLKLNMDLCMKKKIGELFGVDIRSLAIFRIGVALTLLWDLITRSRDIVSHYSDAGVMPRDMLIGALLDDWIVSFHLISGLWQVQFFLFLIAALFATAMLIGYRTKVATIVSWLFLISLHARNPLVLQGGDVVLRLMLFWGMFLPLGAALSIDRKLKKETQLNPLVVSFGSAGLLLQVAMIYWFTAILKTDVSWRQDGTAIWYALNIEQFTKPLGYTLLQYPELMRVLTFATLYLEAFGPFLAFSPVFTAPLRLATAALFIVFHLIGLNLTMELGHFSYICAIAWCAFIPTAFWDKIWKLQGEVRFKATRLSNSFAAFFIAYIVLWNVRTCEINCLPQQLDFVGSTLRIDQYWNMFSPFPLKEDGWYVIPAMLQDGTTVDLFKNGESITYEKPSIPLVKMYENDRWRSYLMNLVFDEQNEACLLCYAQYLTRKWNASHSAEKQVVSFDIDFMLKIMGPDGPSVPKKLVLWEHRCD